MLTQISPESVMGGGHFGDPGVNKYNIKVDLLKIRRKGVE
jgi:hypothetical protein